MSSDFATLQVNGRMTKDPQEFKVGDTSKVVFAVAVNRNFKKGDEWQKKTTFIDCVAWRETAQRVMQYGKKGVKVVLTGDLEDDRYEKDGKEVKHTNLNVRNISIFSAKEDGEDAVTPPKNVKSRQTGDEVPF